MYYDFKKVIIEDFNSSTKVECQATVTNSSDGTIHLAIGRPNRQKIHINKGKGGIITAFAESYLRGGVNGIENGSMEELASILEEHLSLDYRKQGVVSTLEHNSLVRELKTAKQKIEKRKKEKR